jgi:hypothetical protein
MVQRSLIGIPRDFKFLQQLLEQNFPADPLTQAVGRLTQAGNNTDWIQQEADFLSELQQVKDRGGQFDEVIAKILSSLEPETNQNKASTHLVFRRRSDDPLVKLYLSPTIIQRISTVGENPKDTIFDSSRLGNEFEGIARSIQRQLKAQYVLEDPIQYFIDVDDLTWNQFYRVEKSAGLALAFLALAYTHPAYRVLAPYLACFGSYEDGIITRVKGVREKVMAAKERGIRFLILPQPNVHEVQSLIAECSIIAYPVGPLKEVLECIAKGLTGLLQEILRDPIPPDDVPPDWPSVRNEIIQNLQRNESVNLVVPRTIKSRQLINGLRDDFPADFGIVDLQSPATATRRGFVTEILKAFGIPVAIPAEPGEDLVVLGDMLSERPVSRLALLHFDLVKDREKQYGNDLFAALRALMEPRKLVLLIQSRTHLAKLLPSDNPLSPFTINPIELRGRE